MGRNSKGQILRRKSSYVKAKKRWKENNPPNEYGYYECALCGFWIKAEIMTIDHIKPILYFPHLANDESNFQPTHKQCNEWKSRNPRKDFVRVQDFELKKKQQVEALIKLAPPNKLNS